MVDTRGTPVGDVDGTTDGPCLDRVSSTRYCRETHCPTFQGTRVPTSLTLKVLTTHKGSTSPSSVRGSPRSVTWGVRHFRPLDHSHKVPDREGRGPGGVTGVGVQTGGKYYRVEGVSPPTLEGGRVVRRGKEVKGGLISSRLEKLIDGRPTEG